MREIVFESVGKYANPYTEVDVFVDFFGSEGETVRRPAFWDGGNVWRVRAALPASSEKWTWRSICSEPRDTGLHNRQGAVAADTNSGLLRMSPGGRSVVRADGFPFFLAGDGTYPILRSLGLPLRYTRQGRRDVRPGPAKGQGCAP